MKLSQRRLKFIAIFSDDDPAVPFSDSEIFANMLGAKIITEHGKKHGKKHFSGSDGIIKLSSTLESVLEIAGEK